ERKVTPPRPQPTRSPGFPRPSRAPRTVPSRSRSPCTRRPNKRRHDRPEEKGALGMAATESDPIALQSFALLPEPVPSEVLGTKPMMEVWALRLSGGSVREVLAGEAESKYVQTHEYVFALPL